MPLPSRRRSSFFLSFLGLAASLTLLLATALSASAIPTTNRLIVENNQYVRMAPPNRNPSLPTTGLIIIHGAECSPSSYLDLSMKIQDAVASTMNLWIIAPKSLIPAYPDPITTNRRIDAAIDEIRSFAQTDNPTNIAFDPSKHIFLAGHSLGGIFASGYVNKPVAGLMLWASFLKNAQDFMVDLDSPSSRGILHISGDMDPLTPPATLLPQFEQLERVLDTKGSDFVLTKRPVVILPDITHIQFTSRPNFTNSFGQSDISAIIPNAEAHDRLSKVISQFMIAQLPDTPTSSLDIIRDAVTDTEILLHALRSASLISNDELCIETQQVLLGDRENRLNLYYVNTEFEHKIPFSFSKPFSRPAALPRPYIQTYSFLQNSTHVMGRAIGAETPDFLACKSQSREGVFATLAESTATVDTTLIIDEPVGTCSEMNREIILAAESLVTPWQLERYKTFGRVLKIGQDTNDQTGYKWLSQDLVYTKVDEKSQDGTVIKKSMIVSAPSLKTDMTGSLPQFNGKYYCKILTPARVVEYIMTLGFIEGRYLRF